MNDPGDGNEPAESRNGGIGDAVDGDAVDARNIGLNRAPDGGEVEGATSALRIPAAAHRRADGSPAREVVQAYMQPMLDGGRVQMPRVPHPSEEQTFVRASCTIADACTLLGGRHRSTS